jgi:hypothetical protein
MDTPTMKEPGTASEESLGSPIETTSKRVGRQKGRQATSSNTKRRTAAASPLRVVPSRSRAEHYAAGKALREKCPRDAHAAWNVRERVKPRNSGHLVDGDV